MVYLPLSKMVESVSWDDDNSQYEGGKKHVPNHQPVRIVCQQNSSTLKTCIRRRLPLGNHAEQESSENHQQLQQSFTTFISYRGRLIMEFTQIPKTTLNIAHNMSYSIYI